MAGKLCLYTMHLLGHSLQPSRARWLGSVFGRVTHRRNLTPSCILGDLVQLVRTALHIGLREKGSGTCSAGLGWEGSMIHAERASFGSPCW